MNKKFFALISLMIFGGMCVAISCPLIRDATLHMNRAVDYEYNMTLTNSNTPISLTDNFGDCSATPSRYVTLNYKNAKKIPGVHCVLGNGGFIKNDLLNGFKVKGLKSILVNFSGSLNLVYGIEEQEDFSVELTSGEAAEISGNSFKLLSTGETSIISVLLVYSCTEIMPTLNKVENLKALRVDDNNIRLTFDNSPSVNYQLRVDGNNDSKCDFVSGTNINLPLAEGTHTFEVRVYDEDNKLLSPWATLSHSTTYRDNYVDGNGNKWTIWVDGSIPYGNGTLVYENGNTFVGTFESNWWRKEGKLTFVNGCYYNGKFVNDKYNDTNGEFSWPDGWLYKGNFVNGDMTNLKGTLYSKGYRTTSGTGWWILDNITTDAFPGFAANQTTGVNSKYVTWYDSPTNYNYYVGPINIDANKAFNTTGLNGTLYIGRSIYKGQAGLYYWSGAMRNDFWPATSTHGTGEIQFQADAYKDWYIGSVLHNGDGDSWIRDGVGTERWSNGSSKTIDGKLTWAWKNASEAFKNEMESKNLYQDKLTAVFDKNYSGGWINGDGYWYIQDADGQPYGYVSGTWEGSVVRKGNISPDSIVKLDPDYVGTIDLTNLW